MTNRRLKSKALLAAPIVATALFGSACEPRVYRNPGPPQQPQPPTTASTPEPDTAPTASPDTPPTATPDTPPKDGLPDPPNEKGGAIMRRDDGTCLYQFPPPDMSCPPTAHCNPGPPRKPIAVKCPNGGGI